MAERVLSVWPGLRPAMVAAGLERLSVRSAGRHVLEESTYHDAADLRLLRSGVELVRDPVSGAWQVTVAPSRWWHAALGEQVVRWTEADTSAPPAALRGLLRGASVIPAVRLRTRRQTWWVEEEPEGVGPVVLDEVPADLGELDEVEAELSEATEPVGPSPFDVELEPPRAELALEEVSIFDGRRLTSRSTVLRVRGDAGLVRRLTEALVEAGAERLAGRAGDGDGAVTAVVGGISRRPVVAVDPLGSDPSAGEVVRLAIARSVARLLANDVIVRLDLHPEGVHQARVATRRLRSDLQTFAELVEPSWTAALRDELRWVADALGAVRDADVMGIRLREMIGRLEPGEQTDATFLVDELADQRETAVAELAAVMDSARYLTLLDRLVAAAADPHLTPAADAPAEKVFAAHAAGAWKPMDKAARRVLQVGPATVDIDRIHALRIRAKRFRYAADAAALVDPDAARHAAAVGELQDELGELNDAAVTEAWLRTHLANRTSAEAFVLGQLVMAERDEITRRRTSWVPAWDGVHRRRRRRWMR
jgi:CHAD domain-containing protein